MNNFNLKKFPQEYQKVSNPDDIEFFITSRKSDGKSFKITKDQMRSALRLDFITEFNRIPSVPSGDLPDISGATEDKYMEVTDVGSYYYDGELIGANELGYKTIFWWDHVNNIWMYDGSIKVMGNDGPNGMNGANYKSDSQGTLAERPDIVPVIPEAPNREYIYLATNGKYYAGIQGTSVWFEMYVGTLVYNIIEW